MLLAHFLVESVLSYVSSVSGGIYTYYLGTLNTPNYEKDVVRKNRNSPFFTKKGLFHFEEFLCLDHLKKQRVRKRNSLF